MFIVMVLLFIYWRYNIGPVSGNTDCQIERTFKSYEFEAEVVNKYIGADTKAITLDIFEKERATLDLTLEKNGLFEHLVLGDTLRKKLNSLTIHINNFDKNEEFDMAFDCK